MINTSEDELICDLAETYNIFDYHRLSPVLVATFLMGLREDSRVKMKQADTRVTIDQMLNAMIVDHLGFLCWAKTKDGQKGRNRPKKVLDVLLERTEEHKKDEFITFETPEEYLTYIENKHR